MFWQLTLVMLIAISVCSVVLIKVVADRLPKRSIGIFYQYLFCATLAIAYAALNGKVEISSGLILVGAVGFINAFGAYFQWQAYSLSLSKTALFFPLMEALTIALAITFLEEADLWNNQLIFGAMLCFAAMWLFRLPNSEGKDKEILSGKWLSSTILMVLIFGLVGFLVKLFSFQIPMETFLTGWYVGALVGAIPILALEKQNPFLVSKKTILIIMPVSITIIGALFALYWTYQLGGPVAVVLPIRGLAITAIPALLGLFVFKERKELSKREWLGFAIGVVGVILILLK